MFDITKAVQALKDGKLVAFPTETVYGLGADASNPVAIKKVFAAKGRPADHPVIVHIADASAMSEWGRDIPDAAFHLAECFWPGPLTLLLKKSPKVSNLITGGRDTIGLRIPRHPLTLELLQKFDGAIVGPSANRYGHVSPTTVQHVLKDMEGSIAGVLDGGACDVGIESTILDMSTNNFVVRRQGQISTEQIAKVLQSDISVHTSLSGTPGSAKSHYAPATPVILVETEILSAAIDQDCSVMSFQSKPSEFLNPEFWQQLPLDPAKYARELYANLRMHDQMHSKRIVIEKPPVSEEWLAIIDRLTRASSQPQGLLL